MAIKLKVPKLSKGFSFSAPWVRITLAGVLLCVILGTGTFAYFYIKYQHIIDRKMSGPVFENTARIYAVPKTLHPGDKATREKTAGELRRAGYTVSGEKNESKIGTFQLEKDGIEIRPGAESFHNPEGAKVTYANGAIHEIHSLASGATLSAYDLEPEILTGLFDTQQRIKRRLVNYDEIPPVLVRAVLAIEDRHFFEHSGVNYLSWVSAILDDLRGQRRGASTLTMQLSRGLFLTPEKTITRKLTEMLIAIQLEQRYSKQQIFEFYANQINLGQRGSFAINGFGEAAQAYFSKDIKNLTVPEAALLAALIQRPSYLNPYNHPDRAMARRNLVLEAMVETGSLKRDEADKAKATALKLAPYNVEASDAPYFVDLLKETQLNKYSEEQLNQEGMRIYSTIDPDLQRAAAEAIAASLPAIDAQVKKNRTKRVKNDKGKFESVATPGPPAQVALIAMDPKTGEILALVGGRNYGFSQLNHILAKRPTGSIFKPFVYAAALNTAINGQQPVFTPISLINDEPTTFNFDDKVYEPRNFKDEYYGLVTARFALQKSLNNATVKLAEQVGYDKVAEIAKAAGINSVVPTPAMAIGSYDATPLDMASAYTVIANGGIKAYPKMLRSIRDSKGDVIEDATVKTENVLDPRVAFVLTNMMENVVNAGTANEVRRRGFTPPAAGKTGSSHDAWFAGFTSNLICIVWVGLDDYTDIKLTGGTTAAPIWAEFMKRAVQIQAYSNTTSFHAPDGVVMVSLDKVTNKLATPSCQDTYTQAFIAGTEPRETCDQSTTNHEPQNNKNQTAPILVGASDAVAVSNTKALLIMAKASTSTNAQNRQEQIDESKGQNPSTQKKKGFFGKVFGVFKDKDSKQAAPPSTVKQSATEKP